MVVAGRLPWGGRRQRRKRAKKKLRRLSGGRRWRLLMTCSAVAEGGWAVFAAVVWKGGAIPTQCTGVAW